MKCKNCGQDTSLSYCRFCLQEVRMDLPKEGTDTTAKVTAERNPDAYCDNCPYMEEKTSHTKDPGSLIQSDRVAIVCFCQRTPQKIEVDLFHVCGEHPEFFKEVSNVKEQNA